MRTSYVPVLTLSVAFVGGLAIGSGLFVLNERSSVVTLSMIWICVALTGGIRTGSFTTINREYYYENGIENECTPIILATATYMYVFYKL